MKPFLHVPLKRRILLVFLGLIIWSAISIPTTYKIAGWGKPKEQKNPSNIVHQTKEIENYVILDIQILSTDLAKRTMKAYVIIDPKGIYTNKEKDKWNTAVELQFLYKNFNIKNGSTIEPVTFDIPLETGNILHYPFDSYRSTISLDVYQNSTGEYLPTIIYALAVSQTTFTSFKGGEIYEGSNIVRLEIKIKRTPLVYVFCAFISCVTWGLAIVVSNIAVDYAFYNRVLPNGLLSIGITMLFAIPTLRKAQPDIPDIGCAIDFLCFIWCETIIGISACMILYTWLLRFNTTAPPPPRQENKAI
jgi:hypothetical protein